MAHLPNPDEKWIDAPWAGIFAEEWEDTIKTSIHPYIHTYVIYIITYIMQPPPPYSPTCVQPTLLYILFGKLLLFRMVSSFRRCTLLHSLIACKGACCLQVILPLTWSQVRKGILSETYHMWKTAIQPLMNLSFPIMFLV